MADEDHVPDELRCTRSDGRRWRCKLPSLPGKLLCGSHFHRVRLVKSRKNSGSGAASAAPAVRLKSPSNSPPPSPPATDDEGNEEIRVPGRDHLDRRTKRKHSWALDMMDAYCVVDDDTMAYPSSGVGDVSNINSQKNVSDKKRRRRKKKTNETPEEGPAVVDKEMDKNSEEDKDKDSKEEVMRELSYGRMAISPPQESLKEPTGNSRVKLGLNPSDCRLVNPKCRTKNIDPLPIVTVKAVPYAENVKDKAGEASALLGWRRKCHWCKRNRDVSLIMCLTCKKTSFCSDCIKERCIDAKEIERRCIVCRGTCECNSCKTNHSNDASPKESSKKQKKVGEHHSLHYLINQALPILEQINKEQRTEMEVEAKLKAINAALLYWICIEAAQLESRVLMSGDTEHTSDKKSVSGSNAHAKKKKTNILRQNDGSSDSDIIFCASLELGGCGTSALDLKCVFPLNYTTELETNAREIILSKDSPKLLDASLHCSLCSAMAKDGSNRKELLEASRRKHPGDNFLYSPSIHDSHEALLIHFQKHWRNSHPVVVRDLLENTSNMTWDPISLFSNYLKMCISRSENGTEETDDPISLDWYKVEFSSKDSFSGSVLKVEQSSCETLKLKAELSSALSQRVFADHYAILIDALPIQEYTNPGSGILNLAALSEVDSQVSKSSPHVYIACGSAEEIRRGGLVAELRYSSHDLVNVLVHASTFPWSSDQINKIKSLMRMKNVKEMGGFLDDRITRDRQGSNQRAAIEDRSVGAARTLAVNLPGSETESDSSMLCSGTSGSPEKSVGDKFLVDPTQPSNSKRQSGDERPTGAQWDVFRRQDAPKLLEYIQKHKDEFHNSKGSSNQFTDLLLEGNFFLDSAHKMKLKDEYKIEPWTFTQKLGEAVLIPAGCPYQITNLESCMNVVLGFISPENAGESIKLTEKLQALPVDNKAKASKLEVKKMVINKISKAIEELHSEARN
ncbi:hypothetical protein V2J09_009339 [Rumex salicifolius]